jgi:hypothetical protein
MSPKIPADQIGVKLTGLTSAQSTVADIELEADFTTATTATWLKPVDVTRLRFRIDAVLSNMASSHQSWQPLFGLRKTVYALPDQTTTELIEAFHLVFDVKDRATTPGEEAATDALNALHAITQLAWRLGAGEMPQRDDGQGRPNTN